MTGIPIFGPNAFSYEAPSSPGGGWGGYNASRTTSTSVSDLVRSHGGISSTSSSSNSSTPTITNSRTASAAGWINGKANQNLKHNVITGNNSNSNNNNNSNYNNSTNNTINNNNKIFVGGISWQSTEESLQTYFEQYGPVESVEIMRDRTTGNPRGFAFIHLTLPATADNIISLKKNHIIDAKTVDVKRAHARTIKTNNPQILEDEDVLVPTSDEVRNVEVDQMNSAIQKDIPEKTFLTTTTTASSAATTKTTKTTKTTTTPYCYNNNNNNNNSNNKIFIGGLHPSVDREELKAHFSIYGYIKDACVMFDPKTKRSRGFGFITYQEGYQAYCAINQRHTFRDKVVELKYAQPKLSTIGQQPTQQQQQSTLLPPSPPPITTTTTTTTTAATTTPQNHWEDYEEKEEGDLMCFIKQTQLQKEICQLQKSVQDIRQSERLLISLLHNQKMSTTTSISTSTQKHHNLMVAIIQSLQQRILSKGGKYSFTPFHDRITTTHTTTTTTTTSTTNNDCNKVNTTSMDSIRLESLAEDSSLVDLIVQLDNCLASLEYHGK